MIHSFKVRDDLIMRHTQSQSRRLSLEPHISVPDYCNDAHKIIEAFMVCANCAVAQYMQTVIGYGFYRQHLRE